MDERERDYLRQHIRQLERSKRRWKLATVALAAALAIFLVAGGVSSFLFGILQKQRQAEQAMMEFEEARAAAEAARLQAQQAAQQGRQEEGRAKD